MKTVRFARYPGQSARIIFAPLLLAQQRGYFHAEGLDVIVVEPEDHPWQCVSRGEADLGVGYIDYCARPEFAGKIVAIAVQERLSAGRGLPALLARPQLVQSGALASEAGLRGRPIGLTWGRGDDYLTFAFVLERGGLTIGDVTCVPVPHEGDARRRALANGEIDVIIGRRPRQIEGEVAAGHLARWKSGPEIRAEWQNRFIVAATAFIAREPEACAAFLRAHQHGVDDYVAGTQSGTPADDFLPELTALSEETPELLRTTLPAAFPRNCAIDIPGVRADVERMRAVDLFPAGVAVEDIIDMRFAPVAV